MKNTFVKIGGASIGVFVCLFVHTIGAEAYFTKSQSAQAIGPITGLFLIEYDFGMKTHNVHMPPLAAFGDTLERDTVSYQIIDEDGNVAIGTSLGAVLSGAPFKGGMYVTDKGLGRRFTLAVAFTPAKSPEPKKYRLQVTQLPFNFDGTQELQLNPSELKYYTTKYLSL